MIGYRYFHAKGGAWRYLHGALVPLDPPHTERRLTYFQAIRLLVRRGAFLVRWDEDFDRTGPGEWWHVILDRCPDMSSLSGNTRSKIRRGAKRLEACALERATILREGYAVYEAAYDRYATFEPMLAEDEFCSAVAALPEDTEFWGVRDRESGQLMAFSENLVRHEACFYVSIWYRPEALKAYAGYLLIHEMNNYYLNERGLRYVSDGARNISHATGIHEFLESKFGFRRAYSRLRVVYFPGLGMLVRALYPFRGFFQRSSASAFQKIGVLLEQERIRRACRARRGTA